LVRINLGIQVVILLLMSTAVLCFPFTPVKASTPLIVQPGRTIWAESEHISSGGCGLCDVAKGVALDSTGAYVVGIYTNDTDGYADWRIEKRDLATGSIIWGQSEHITDRDDQAYGVAVDSSGVYVVGYYTDSATFSPGWRMEKRSLTTGSIIWSASEDVTGDTDYAYGVAVDSSGVYVVGWDQGGAGSNRQWRIEKRSLATGAFIIPFGIGGVVREHISSDDDFAYGVAVDSSGVYIVGTDENTVGSYDEWRVEKRSLISGALTWAVSEHISNRYDWAGGVAVDGSGIYITGSDQKTSGYKDEWRVEKRSLTTGTMNWALSEQISGAGDASIGIAVDATGAYVAGYDKNTLDNRFQLRVEKRNLASGSLIPAFGPYANGTLTEHISEYDDVAWGVAAGSSGVYVVGQDENPGETLAEWRIEAIAGVVGVQLYAGWNLISLPLIPNDPSAQNMLTGMGARKSLSVVWAYVGTPRAWKYFMPGKSSTLTTMNDGYGYWFYMSKADILFVDGTVIPPAGMPPSYALVAGWNLVGFKSQPNADETKSVGTYLSSISGSYDLNNVWIYENPGGAWTRADSGYVLQPGQAMWVLMTAPAVLRP
jgi:hypothetical protein